MTDDLVKRLREEALALHVAGWRDPAGGQDTTISAVLADDAADRIEALAADRENRLADLRIIKAERDRLREALESLQAQKLRLSGMAYDLNKEVAISDALLISEAEASLARLERAEKAEAEKDNAWAALWDILACETPNANATVTRMVAIAKAALKGETP